MKQPSLLEKAKLLIDEHIRPMIQSDGGDIEVVELTSSGVLRIRLVGACSQCSAAPMTVSFGIEAHIRDLLPEIKSVEQAS